MVATTRIGFLSIFTASIIAGVFACTTTTTSTDDPTADKKDAGKDKDDDKKDAGKDDEDKDEDEDKEPATGDEACAEEANFSACLQCCGGEHQAGVPVLNDSLVACACEGTGADAGVAPCATECAETACADKLNEVKEGDDCDKCLNAAEACGNYSAKQCADDPECAKLIGCAQGCPQN